MIKVTPFEGTAKDVTHHAGMTVQDALTAGEVMPGKDMAVKVNGKKQNMTHGLRDGDRVTVTPNIKNG